MYVYSICVMCYFGSVSDHLGPSALMNLIRFDLMQFSSFAIFKSARFWLAFLRCSLPFIYHFFTVLAIFCFISEFRYSILRVVWQLSLLACRLWCCAIYSGLRKPELLWARSVRARSVSLLRWLSRFRLQSADDDSGRKFLRPLRPRLFTAWGFRCSLADLRLSVRMDWLQLWKRFVFSCRFRLYKIVSHLTTWFIGCTK